MTALKYFANIAVHINAGGGENMFDKNIFKKLMKEKNINIPELRFRLAASGVKVADQTLRNWLSGAVSPSMENVSILANFFNKPVGIFFVQKRAKKGQKEFSI